MLLEVDNLNIHFETQHGPVHAVRNLSFKVNQGETLGVVGESGCGKSITNLAIMQLLSEFNTTISANKLNFKGVNLLQLKDKEMQEIRGKKMAMIFQDPMSSLNPSFSIGLQIEEMFITHQKELSKKERKIKVLELLDQVGIPDPEKRINSFPHELSGGMNQRVVIAMAIACKPDLLIADEPTTALDVTIQKQILNLLKDLQKKHNMAMILVTHDLGLVSNYADKIQVMYAGEIVESATVDEIINNPKHPYTEALLKSIPSESTKLREKLFTIPSMVPDLLFRPTGCQFHPRCSYVQEDCKMTRPGTNNNESLVYCHHPIQQEKN